MLSLSGDDKVWTPEVKLHVYSQKLVINYLVDKLIKISSKRKQRKNSQKANPAISQKGEDKLQYGNQSNGRNQRIKHIL